MNGRPLKIVYCTPALYSAGGIERVVSVKASYFAEHFGYDVTVITTEDHGRHPFFPVSPKVRLIDLNLNFEELWHASFLQKVWLYLRKQRRYRQLLTNQLLRLRPDITVSVLRREINFLNNIHDGSLKVGELHVNRANYRSFSTRGHMPLMQLFSRLWMSSLLSHLRQLDRFVVLTDQARADWPELTNVSVIPDPLSISFAVPASLTAKRLVTIGRYDYDKGFDLLLRVWKQLEHRFPDWQLDVYGMGDRSAYVSLRTELNLDPQRCQLHGPVNEVAPVLQQSSVFVLPSRFEGFGLVIIEAMAFGLPVVSFDCDNGPRAILADGDDGYLVPPFDVSVMADRLTTLMSSIEVRRQMGTRAHSHAQRYALNTVAQQWKQLFDHLTETR